MFAGLPGQSCTLSTLASTFWKLILSKNKLNKKPCLCDRVPKYKTQLFHLPESSGRLFAGACPGSVAGCEVEVGTVASPALLEALAEPPDIKNVDKRQRTPTIPANSQVPFSNTSVVCFTPINWLLKPAIFPARPPPFGF